MLCKPKTLMILTPGFPKDEGDNTCLPLQQALVRSIKKHYPEVNLLILSFQYPFKKRSYTWCGVPVVAFGGRSRGKLFRVYNWIKVWQDLNKIRKNKEMVGLLSFWLGECAFVGEKFARTYNLKHYCWILGQDAKPNNRYCKLANIPGSNLLALSDFLAGNMYINYEVMPQHMIPGGIDGAMFADNEPERHIDLLAAGSLIPLKQYHLFIEVVCRLRKWYPEINAVLCGAGSDKALLQGMIKKLKMEKHITLTGELPHDEVLTLMQRSKVFLHPSNYEGLGMVCLEALYAGAKVISFVKPMDDEIPNWHIAINTYEMAGIAASFLGDTTMEYHSVAPYQIADTAKQMMELYLDKPSATPLIREAIAEKESVDW